jgi:histidine triad (HIT) family protein
VVYEDERVVAFLDINPATEGHVLLVPRAHARTIYDLDEADAAAMMVAATRVARALRSALEPHGLTLFQANEEAGWQDVFHVHLHLVPRWPDDRLISPWTDALVTSDLPAVADRIRSAMGA